MTTPLLPNAHDDAETYLDISMHPSNEGVVQQKSLGELHMHEASPIQLMFVYVLCIICAV